MSHNNDASVGQWMFVSTTVVSVRIASPLAFLLATAALTSNWLIRFYVSGRIAPKHLERKLRSINAFFRVRTKS